MTLRLRLLGEPAIERGSGLDVERLERHDAALLALLALRGRMQRGLLAELLWPDTPSKKAHSSLRQRVHRLRETTPGVLAGDKESLWLEPGLRHDLVPDELPQAARDFELLGNLHYPAGEPLGNLVGTLREQWAVERARVLEHEALRLQQAGEMDKAAGMAERLALCQPTSELAHRLCMTLHYLRGDRSQALSAYERCRTKLRAMLDIDPAPETIELAKVIAAGELPGRVAAHAGASAALLKPPRLVGRQRIWSLLEEARDGRLAVVLQGEAGIGKTRLATDFAQTKAPSLMVKAHEAERAAPFSLARRVLLGLGTGIETIPDWAKAELARFMPAWGPAPPTPPEPQRLRQSFITAMSPWTKRRHALLVLDDVQWADAASLELLLAWLSGTQETRPAAVLCVRTEELPAAIAEWMARQPTNTLHREELGPLDRASVEELVSTLALPTLPGEAQGEAAANLVRLTSGHPLVMLELLRASPDSWSWRASDRVGWPADRLSELLRQRIARLPAELQRAVRVAALAGPSFTLGLAADVLNLTGAALTRVADGLKSGQLLDENGHLLDVVRETVVQETPEAVAASLHARLADSLTTSQARPEVLAAHRLAARQWAEAGDQFEMAAMAARATRRTVEELGYWDSAARCFSEAGDATKAWAAKEQGVPAALNAESGKALSDRLEDLERQAPDDKGRLTVLLARSRAILNTAAGVGAVAPSEEALAIAKRLGDWQREVVAAGWHGLALTMSGRMPEGLELLRGYAEAAKRVEDPRIQLDFAGSLGYALHLAGHYEEALDALRTATEVAESLGDLGEALEQAGNTATCLGSLGRREEAIEQGELAVSLWRRLGEPKSVTGAAMQVQLSASYYGNGRFREALNLLEWSLGCFRELGPPSWQTITEHRLAVIYTRLGQLARARQVLTPLPPEADAGRHAMRAMIECRLDHLSGKSVTERLQSVADRLGDKLAPMDRRTLLLLLSAHLPASDSLRVASKVYEEATGSGDAPAARHAAARMAEAHRQLGNHSEAGRYASTAWSFGADAPTLDIDHPSLCLLVYRASSFARDEETAKASLQSGIGWLYRALPNVPESFRESFRTRNPVNWELLSLSSSSRH
jgi:DNA-binding SARP family transcriptional activator